MRPEERLKRKNEFDGDLVVGARQFNITTGRDIHLKQRNQGKEKAQLIDPATGLLQEELSIWRSCPVCGSDEAKLLFIKEGFRHLKCPTCGMVYVNPVLSEERLHSFYQDEDSYRQVLLNKLNLSLDRKKFQYGLDLIEEYLPQKGNLLDVGCGPGVFLEVARERGWHVCGVEFNSWCVQHLREMNIDVIDVPIQQASLPHDFYQCVTLWAVLEHIVDPENLLKDIHRILTTGGILLILVPNIDSLANRLLHERSATFAGEAHVNLFSASTLARLLKKVEFELIECETVLTLLGTINNYLNYEDPQFGEGDSVLDFLTPEYIHQRMLGYLLLALVRVNKQ